MGAVQTLKRHAGAQARKHPALVADLTRAARRLGLGSAAGRLDRAADLVRVVPEPGAPFHVLSCAGRDQVAGEVERHGWASFEQPLPAVLAALVRRFCAGGTFADIGANTGYYALLAAAVEPSVAVDAYEPYPPVLETLEQNVAINRAHRVRVHGVALGAAAGTATLYVPVGGHGLVETSSSLNPRFSHSGVGREIEVEVTTLDAVYPSAVEAPALLKIDVESLEAEVVAGGAAMIERRRPLLVLELLPHAGPEALEALRGRFGYVDVRLRPGTAIVTETVEPDADAWNHLWCPAGDLDGVLAVLRNAGLGVVGA